MLKRGDWAIEASSQTPCQVVDVEEVWGARSYRVWLPTQATVLRVAEPRLVPFHTRPTDVVGNELAFVSAAARIADAMARDALVAPLEGTVTPLPHQVHALSRAMATDRVRYLLADEVGLGKTVEAGLIFRELKIRGLVRRVLVVAPAGLVTQWVQELKTHFGETFRLVIPGELSAVRELAGLDEDANAWRLHDQVVCPLDSVKPLDARRGWTREQVARFRLGAVHSGRGLGSARESVEVQDGGSWWKTRRSSGSLLVAGVQLLRVRGLAESCIAVALLVYLLWTHRKR